MRKIHELDLQDYNDCTHHIKRTAHRGIIFIGDKLAMIRSQKYGEYKFPGGGQENNESSIMTLAREVKEETGLEVIVDTIKEYGYFLEKRCSYKNSYDLFEQISKYYMCKVSDNIHKTNYSSHEIEWGYRFELVDIDEAIKVNEQIYNNTRAMVIRELLVLVDIKQNLKR